jgi:hypothetical protein
MTQSVGQSARSGKYHFAGRGKICGLIFQRRNTAPKDVIKKQSPPGTETLSWRRCSAGADAMENQPSSGFS